MDNVSIRPAGTGDIETMRAIELDAGALFAEIGLDSIANDPAPAPEVFQRHIEDGSIWVAVLDVDGNVDVVGYLAASVVDGEGHVDQVSVSSAAQGNGIGAELIDRAIDWTRSLAMSSITLTTFSDVAWNGPYYERLGFSPIADDELGQQLAAIRESERQAGIDVLPRVAMRRMLT